MNWPLVTLILLVVLEHVVLFLLRDAITFDPAKAGEKIKALFAKKP